MKSFYKLFSSGGGTYSDLVGSRAAKRRGISVTPAQIVRAPANLEAVFVRPQGAHSFP